MLQDNNQPQYKEPLTPIIPQTKSLTRLKLNSIDYSGNMSEETAEQLISQQQTKDYQLKVKQLEKQSEVDAVVVIFGGILTFLLCYATYLGVSQIRTMLQPAQTQSSLSTKSVINS